MPVLVRKKEIELFSCMEYAYVYVDQNNALQRFSDNLSEHEEEYRELKDHDKDWRLVKDGYFILLSNVDTTPEKLLSEYFGRAAIESVVKTSKENLGPLPFAM